MKNKPINQLLAPQPFRETVSSRNNKFRKSQSQTPNIKAINQIINKSKNKYPEESPASKFNKNLISVQNSNFQGSEPKSMYSNSVSQLQRKRMILKDHHGKTIDPITLHINSTVPKNPFLSVYNNDYIESQSTSQLRSPRDNSQSLANLLETSSQQSLGIIQKNFKNSLNKQLNDNQLQNYHSYRRSYNSNTNSKSNLNYDENEEYNTKRIIDYQRSKYQNMYNSNSLNPSQSQQFDPKNKKGYTQQSFFNRKQSSDTILSQISNKNKNNNNVIDRRNSQEAKINKIIIRKSNSSEKNSIYNQQIHNKIYKKNQQILDKIFDEKSFQENDSKDKSFQKHFKKKDNKKKDDNNKTIEQTQNQNLENQDSLQQDQNNENNNNNFQACLLEYLDDMHQKQGLSEPMDQSSLENMVSQYVQQNLGYFEHKAGMCLCSLCSCGFCKVNCLVHNQEIRQNNMKSKIWASNYAKEFKKKQGFKQEWDPKKAYDQYTSKLPGEFKSIQQGDYTQKEQQNRYKRKKPEQQQQNPFFGSTSYGTQYYDYNVNCYIPIKQSHCTTVIPNTHLNGKSSYNNDFEQNKNYKSHKEKIIKPTPLKPFPHIDMFFADTTNKHEHGYKHQNQTNKIDAPLNSYVLGAPQYKGQFQTDYQKNFAKYQNKCQARQILNEKFNLQHEKYNLQENSENN